MKKYLWTTLALFCITLNASDNPFDLKENINALDNEDELLFAEIKKSKKAKPLIKKEIAKEEKTVIKKPIKKEIIKITEKEKKVEEVLNKEEAEVKAYEKKRAEKLLKIKKAKKEKVIKKAVISKKVLEKKVIKKEITKKKEAPKKDKYADIAVDINLTAERLARKHKADLEYEKAVKEMDMPD